MGKDWSFNSTAGEKKNKVIILFIEDIDFRALRDLELGDLY
jgi:hypothetical protein